MIGISNGGQFYWGTSSDGNNWEKDAIKAYLSLRDVTYGNGKFVAGGSDGVIYNSSDGQNWIQIPNNNKETINAICIMQ